MNSTGVSHESLTPSVSQQTIEPLMEAFPRGLVEHHLKTVLRSHTFSTTPILRKFLKHIIYTFLVDGPQRIKEYAVGIEVFGRTDSFDPRLDPIVRVEARRLRAKLQTYYETEGSGEPLRILVPKGGYIPFIIKSDAPISVFHASPSLSEMTPYDKGIAVLPFSSLGAHNDIALLADGMVEELIDTLTTMGDFLVVPLTSVLHLKGRGGNVKRLGQALCAHMLVEGSVRSLGRDVRISIRLIDTSSGYLVSAQIYNDTIDTLSSNHGQLCLTIASWLRGQLLSAGPLRAVGSEVSRPGNS